MINNIRYLEEKVVTSKLHLLYIQSDIVCHFKYYGCIPQVTECHLK